MLMPWAHWVTPAEEKWRYDTRFYLTILPEPQQHAQGDAFVRVLAVCHREAVYPVRS